MSFVKEPQPPKKYLRGADHHWLEIFDCDGHSHGLVVAQWNPGVKLWSQSGQVGSGRYTDTSNWKYIDHCPLPSLGQQLSVEAESEAYASNTDPNPALAAVRFALENDEPITFLRLWYEGEFDAIRTGWDDVPAEVFIGADPLFVPKT